MLTWLLGHVCQAKWDATVKGSVGILLCSEEVTVIDCTVTGGCIWVNLGGVLRQARTTRGQTTKITDCIMAASPGCGLLVTGRKSMPTVERCTFAGCGLAGVVAQQVRHECWPTGGRAGSIPSM